MATIKFETLGNPTSVLKVSGDEPVGTLGNSEVSIKMLAAAISPADLSMVAGVGDVRPALPAVGGLGGVGEVTAVGGSVHGLKVGDKVVPLSPAFGCWRSAGKADAGAVAKLPDGVSAEAGAQALAAGTAYRLLKDFAALAPGDVVLQNAAEGAVGKFVVALAKAHGLKSVSVVSAGAAAGTDAALTALGADVVLSEEEAATMAGRQAMAQLGAPKLALNGGGGAGVQGMSKALAPGGALVTYGGRARTAVELSTPALIFRDVAAAGFSMTRWLAFASPEEVAETVAGAAPALKAAGGAGVQVFQFSEFEKAVAAAAGAGVGGDVVVKM